MPLDRLPVNTAVVGVQKAATSTLFSLLAEHPEVAARKKKELHFFDDETQDWSRPDYSGYHVPRRTAQQSVAVDATPVYLFWPPAMERMRAYSPQMRLLASFRDPVERAFSQWMMETGRRKTFPPFDSLVDKSLRRDDPSVPFAKLTRRSRTHSVVARGFYGDQLERALHLFPRQQWLFLDFQDVVRDQDAVCRRMTDFLEVEPFAEPPPPQQKMKSRPVDGGAGKVLDARILERLAAAYADDLALFERLSGVTTSQWPTRRLNEGTLDSVEWAEKLSRKLVAPS